MTWDLSKLGAAIAGKIPNSSSTSFSGCFDNETGWPLKYSTKTKSGTEQDHVVATAVGTPSASDFTPPATPETMPDLGGVTIPSIPRPITRLAAAISTPPRTG